MPQEEETPSITFTSVIFWLFIFMLTLGLLAPFPERDGPPGPDKIIHFSAFLGLGLLHFFEFGRTIKGFILLIVYAASTEYLQGWTDYRSFEWWDMAANFAGCLTSRLLYFSKYQLPDTSFKSSS